MVLYVTLPLSDIELDLVDEALRRYRLSLTDNKWEEIGEADWQAISWARNATYRLSERLEDARQEFRAEADAHRKATANGNPF